MSGPLFDDIVEVMSRASIGDLSARVRVAEHGGDAEPELATLGEMLNVLLGDLEYRVRQSKVTFRDELALDADSDDRARIRRGGHLERVIEAVGEGIWVLDAAGHTVLVNPATELLTGRTRDELLAIAPHDVIGRSDAAVDGAPRPSPVRETVVFAASRRVDEAILSRADGTHVPVAYTAQPIFDDAGAQVGSVLILRDVTVEREAEERKAQFFAMASHELRTPLTAIKGFADTLVHGWDRFEDESRLAFLQIIDQQSDRLVRLINDVLTLSRLERGVFDVDPAPIRVRPVLERVQQVVGEPFEIACSSALLTYCDEDQLEQILLNYASNAAKYGSPPYRMDADVSGDSVRIAVTDHGAGVPDAFRDRLFERFAQAERRPGVAGTGLGLSIAQRLAEAQGGRAWHEPVEPHGARFVVGIPRAARADGPA